MKLSWVSHWTRNPLPSAHNNYAHILRPLHVAQVTIWCFKRPRSEFQMRMSTVLGGLEEVTNIADNILLFGEGDPYDTAEIDHDRHFVVPMERLN